MIKRLIAVAAVVALPAHAAIEITTAQPTYSQSFDSLAASGSANPWANDSTLPGWSLINSQGATVPTYAADTGSSNAGFFKSFGLDGDRALGGVGSGGTYFGSPASGAVAGWIAVAFHNGTGAALDGFNLAFDGEQWRNGGNTSAQTMNLEYGFGPSFDLVTWTAAGSAFAFTSPVIGATAAAVNGNVEGLVANLQGSIATSWAVNDTLWLRWVERNDVGNDHGLAIDNLRFGVSAVPEPGALALLLAGFAVIGRRARALGRRADRA